LSLGDNGSVVTLDRARRFARAYLDEYGRQGRFLMSLPSTEELDKVKQVFEEEMDCIVRWTRDQRSIEVRLPWATNEFLKADAAGVGAYTS
jgi:hypothetical protein